MCNQGMHNKWSCTTNIQVIKTCVTNIQMIKTYIQFIHTTNPASAHVTQPCTMTKLPIKQYQMHTTIKLHSETIPTMILARSLQDLPSPSKLGKIHQCGTSQFNFYIGGTHP